MDRVILIGYFIETVELCEKCGCSISGIVDSADESAYPYLGDDDAFISNYTNYIDVPLVITPDNPAARSRLFKLYKDLGFQFKTLIAPDAVISKSASISEGCMIQSLCNVSSNSVLGNCVRINTGANIMHDSHIGDFSVVAPNAVVLGHVFVAGESYIGANSTILPHLHIGKKSTVGAGAVVTKDVSNNTVVVGIPANRLKTKE